MSCFFRWKTLQTHDVAIQTDISFVYSWSLTDDTGTYINASSGAVLWNEKRIEGNKGAGLVDGEPRHRPDTRPRPVPGYYGFR